MYRRILTAGAVVGTIKYLETKINNTKNPQQLHQYHQFGNGLGLGNVYRSYSSQIHRVVDAELGHSLAIRCLAQPIWIRKYLLGLTDNCPDETNLTVRALQRTFTNPIGIAAGFDKNGEAIQGLSEQGFGFVEIGSITPQPQFGNDKPRVFRLPEDRAIINRYGFNSHGIEAVKRRLQKRPLSCILGINLGKNKSTIDAKEDFVQGIRELGSFSDYMVVNISSPNTPGLRDCQRKEMLIQLIKACRSERDKLTQYKPLLIKISPDLTEVERDDIVEIIKKPETQVDGIIVSNTTTTRGDLLTSEHKNEQGGLSGAPLFDRSTQLISKIYQETEGKILIIGVGGIGTAEQAYTKIKAGATLVQLYTAYAYQGPVLLHEMKRELSQLVDKDGYVSIQQAVGTKLVQCKQS
jgi:dihydroorotate dehydrogenase